LSWAENRPIRSYVSQNQRAEFRIYGEAATYTFNRINGSLLCEVNNGVFVYRDQQENATRVVYGQRTRFVASSGAVNVRCDGLWVDVEVPGTTDAALIEALSTARTTTPPTHPINPRVGLREVVEV
jgi:hypothetical protein